MGHFAKSVTVRASAVAGLAIALALPVTRSAVPVPRAGADTAAPGFTLSVVHQFPAALQTTPKYLALSKDGNLYGATSAVGSSNGTDGMYPTALVQAPDGTLYGTTYYGGSQGDGNAYRLPPGGTFTTLVSCTVHSCLYPIALVIGADGNVYGISEGDKQGFGNNGQLFAVTPKFRTEVNFNTTVADRPWNLELGRDGSFYGTLMGDIHHPGWVYELTPAGAFHIVATFNGRNGAGPDELALGADGSLYGTTEGGGATGGGVIFRLTLPR